MSDSKRRTRSPGSVASAAARIDESAGLAARTATTLPDLYTLLSSRAPRAVNQLLTWQRGREKARPDCAHKKARPREATGPKGRDETETG
jgi:hypothetical protein